MKKVVAEKYRDIDFSRAKRGAVVKNLGSLAGASPELAALNEKDLKAAKQIWSRRLNKQLRTLSPRKPRR